MPINDPTITATCDACGCDSDLMHLCTLVRGGWDASNIKERLKFWGWAVDGDKTICEDCCNLDGVDE
jgi:hypothetical protein